MKIMENTYRSIVENQFKAFDNMLEGISVYKLIFDNKGKVVDAKLEYMNHATVDTMDLIPEKSIGMKASELFSSDYLNPIFSSINEFLSTRKFKRFEIYYPPTKKYFLISGFSMLDEYFAVLRIDITELKKAEEEFKKSYDILDEKVEERTKQLKMANESLKESEEKYKQFFEASPNFTVHIDLKGKIIDANRAALEILNKSKEDLTGTNFTELDMVYKEDIPIHIKNFLKLLMGIPVEHYETRIKVNNEVRWGDTYPIILRKYKIPNSVLVISHDITDRKRAEEKLKESEEKFRLIFDKAEDSIVLNKIMENGLPGRIIEVNEVITKKLGYTKEELLKMSPSNIVAPENRPEMANNAKKLNKYGHSIFEIVHITKDGRRIPVEVNNHLIDFKGNKIALAIIRDITDRKKSEKLLKETITELERSNQELQSFAYITSHDLQEPLRTMGSYAGLLKRRYEGKLDNDANDFIEYIISGAERMQTMIKSLLDYSRVGTHGAKFTEFNAEYPLNESISNLKYSIDKYGAKITHENLPNIVADESQIRQVFQNLIGNALKFRKENVKPKIHISVNKKDDEFIFSVSDNGIGIEEQYSDNIFEIFKRLHAIGEYNGAGIGLAIVKRIIERHGGKTWVLSKYGKGSTFYFTIPTKKIIK